MRDKMEDTQKASSGKRLTADFLISLAVSTLKTVIDTLYRFLHVLFVCRRKRLSFHGVAI